MKIQFKEVCNIIEGLLKIIGQSAKCNFVNDDIAAAKQAALNSIKYLREYEQSLKEKPEIEEEKE